MSSTKTIASVNVESRIELSPAPAGNGKVKVNKEIDLPLMANIASVTVNHYTIEVFCDFAKVC